MTAILTAKNISKVYGKKGAIAYTAIRNLSFTMEKGEFIGIMGPSGSGKTTLLNTIATLDPVTEGEITIGETSLSTMNEEELSDFRSQQLGFIFQDFNLLENMSVFENIALPLSLRNTAVPKITATVQQVSSLLGINDILEKFPAEISGGQKQRTAIARALIHNPALLLADEPTGALDSKNAAILMETLSDLNKKQKVSVLMVTHDPLSASYCSRLLFIKDGKIDKELYAASNREQFYKEILEVLAGSDQRAAAGDAR
ncbi:ABC transporter ATP-binding protein [Planococcus sp. NCCP-2050]|uniref:ABC transporter ATP-binding protein n=1 Tax=Planococcus sp. NCCP-2050 TaxID=2944679 RepID=UPI00203A86B8|nr:ABC transporter ATP-binding protein [Planococcus sp. NCCP-2050]GKW47285.1 ABC transporter ATP-binding protein [Planococcus sp. NCCP-2050]